VSVEVKVPEIWENRTIHQFVAPTRTEEFAGNITVAPHETEETMSLDQLVAALPVNDALDDVLVIGRSFQTKGLTRFHERTLRFVDPYQGLLLQQGQRLVMILRKPYVVTYTNVADAYDAGVAAFHEVFDKLVEGAARARATQ
jgi:hypothetical protein